MFAAGVGKGSCEVVGAVISESVLIVVLLLKVP